MSLHKETELLLESPQQLKALANETRAKILRILEDGPASAKQLSGLLEMTHGKVGHHIKVLREAGLIEVVEERPVRAVIERFYGLSFDHLRFGDNSSDRLQFTLAQAAREAVPTSGQPFEPPGVFLTVRMSQEHAADFHRRVLALANEFKDSGDSRGDNVYGLTASVFLTDTPSSGSGR
ncbi:MAG: winged helix-turn-helix domain-containing protein [Acidimicrobiia bacterium]